MSIQSYALVSQKIFKNKRNNKLSSYFRHTTKMSQRK